MRASLFLVTLLSLGLSMGCGGKSSTAPTTASGGTTAGPAGDNANDGNAPRAPGALTFADGSARACMLHHEADGYFRCLSAADGQCFHFGATCQPPKECMYERKSKLHKTCTEVREGRCQAFGATCEPSDACMYDPKSEQYRQCEAASKGACTRFADVCQPLG